MERKLHIPRWVRIGNHVATITYRGQPRTFQFCKELNYDIKECPKLICRVCNKQDHSARFCDHNRAEKVETELIQIEGDEHNEQVEDIIPNMQNEVDRIEENEHPHQGLENTVMNETLFITTKRVFNAQVSGEKKAAAEYI